MNETGKPISRFDIEGQIKKVNYEAGPASLEFSHTFSDGTVLDAHSEDGNVSIVFEKDGAGIADLEEYLGDGYQMITPGKLRVVEEERVDQGGQPFDYVQSKWVCYQPPEEKLLVIGHWTEPQQLLMVLHEIAHSAQDMEMLEQYRTAKIKENSHAWKEKWYLTEEYKKDNVEAAKITSALERDAWARALKMLRELSDKTGVNLAKELFDTPKSLFEYIDEFLRSHKMEALNYTFDEEAKKAIGCLFDKKQ
jgi:hypothetical protein